MNFKLASLVLATGGGVLFGRYVSLERLADSLTPLITIQTVLAAAVLVRLNRGMPTLDWKSVKASSRSSLTSAIVRVTQEYTVLMAVIGLTIIYFTGLFIVGKSNLAVLSPASTAIVMVTAAGVLLGLAIARMSYVVWRDLDIVTLQKAIIDEAGDQERIAEEGEKAKAKIDAMRLAGLTNVEPPPVKAWDDQ